MMKSCFLSRCSLRIWFCIYWMGQMCMVGAACHAADEIEVYAQPLINPIPRQIRLNLVIENPTNRTLTDQIVWLYAPVKRTATQQLEKLDINLPYQLTEDALGNQIIKLQFDQFPPYGTKLVSIRADLLMSASPNPSQLKRNDLFLDEERYVESNDPVIQSTAALVRTPQAADTVGSIYQWVKSNMHYAGYIADDLGARYAVLNKRGDCTEYAYLVTALARANRIAARTLGGYVMDRNGAPRADEYHNWAEAYVDGTWQLLDAQKENFQIKAEQYIAMRIISSTVTNVLEASHRFRVQGAVTVRM